MVAGDVDSDFLHDLDDLGVHVACGLRACALDVEDVASGGMQDAFGHVAAAGVTGAEDQNGGFHKRAGFC